MASVKELRVRINSVGNIKQITRAMEMVATTKLRRFQDRALASRPYAQEIAGLVGRLAAVLGDDLADRPLFRKGAGSKLLMLVVSSDRGLCGAYNSNLFRELEQWRDAHSDQEQEYWVYGRKAFQYMSKRDFNITSFLTEPPLEAIDYRNAAITATMLQNAFLTGKYSEVMVLYSAFESMAKYVPTVAPFLPVSGESLGADDSARDTDVILARGPDCRVRQSPFRDEERDRRGDRHAERFARHLQPQASRKHHQRAARHRRWRRSPQVSWPKHYE